MTRNYLDPEVKLCNSAFVINFLFKKHYLSSEMYELRFLRWWLWRMSFSGMWRRVVLVTNDVSRYITASNQGPSYSFRSSYLFISFHPEYGGDIFLWNVGCYKSHTASHPRRQHSSSLECLREAVNRKLSRRMASSGMLRRVVLVRTDVSEELSVSIIRVTIGELGTLAVTSTRRTHNFPNMF
jgi:hypothetical protein